MGILSLQDIKCSFGQCTVIRNDKPRNSTNRDSHDDHDSYDDDDDSHDDDDEQKKGIGSLLKVVTVSQHCWSPARVTRLSGKHH